MSDVDQYEDDEPFCYTCISSAYWQECDQCDDGSVEDEDWDGTVEYESCQWCLGEGGWWICLGSETHNLDEGSIHRIPLEQREAAPAGGGGRRE